MGYLDGGKISVTEMPAEVFADLIDEVDRAVMWLEANAHISPLVISDGLPAELRTFLRQRRSDVFDSMTLAVQSGAMLVTDDLPTREFHRVLTGASGTWLHVVFGVAQERGHIGADTYVRWSAQLIEAGHDYLGIDAMTLAHAARLDGSAFVGPGSLFATLSRGIGGISSDPQSHVGACVGCLRELWSDWRTSAFRQPATGHLLRQMTRERYDDHPMMLRTVLAWSRDLPDLQRYIRCWIMGHFISTTK